MNQGHWRETVEIVGVVSIVASLLLVAWEIHQSNRISATRLEMQLGQNLAELHGMRSTVPEFARLFPKLQSPEGHLITATESSQILGVAEQMIEIYRAAQIAYDRGLIEASHLAIYQSDLARTLESYPGLTAYVIPRIEADPSIRDMPVFQPVRDLERDGVPAVRSNQTDE